MYYAGADLEGGLRAQTPPHNDTMILSFRLPRILEKGTCNALKINHFKKSKYFRGAPRPILRLTPLT